MVSAIAAVPMPREGLQLVDFASVGIYLLITVAIVFWSSLRQHTTEEYFLGGRRMPWMAVGLSILASLMSSISYMGVPGEMVKNGVTMFYQYIALPFSMTVVLVVWVPFFMRLKITSAYEYLERRFDHRARLLGGLLFLLLRLGWMSSVMYVGSLALSQMTKSLVPQTQLDPFLKMFASSSDNIPLLQETLLYWVIAAVGLTATCYACVGGFRAAIWNDVLQSIMFLSGTLITIGYVVWTTGTGPVDWWRIASENTKGHTAPIWFSFDPTVRMTVFTSILMSFFWTICTHGSDQVVLQRYFSTTSLSAARRSYIVNAMTDLTIGMLLGVCGLALLAFYSQNPTFLPDDIMSKVDGQLIIKHGDRVLPYFFAHQLPAGIGGVVLAVLLCDAMQTLVSGVNSISAVFTTDIVGHLHSRGQRWLSDYGLAKILTVTLGLLVTVMGIGVAYLTRQAGRSIVDMMGPAFNMFLGPLAALFLIGMFLKCRAGSAIAAVVLGVVVSFLWSYWKDLFGTEWQPTITLSSAVPYVASFLMAAFFGLFEKEIPDDPRLKYTWFSMMRRGSETEAKTVFES